MYKYNAFVLVLLVEDQYAINMSSHEIFLKIISNGLINKVNFPALEDSNPF